MLMPYLQKYETVDLGWKIKPWFKIDKQCILDWYSDLERDYSDWKFSYEKHKYMWKRDPGGDGYNGHLFMPDTSWYTLCHNSNIEGPLPPERSMSIKELQDYDDHQLNPRKCFTGYGLEVVRSMPICSKRALVSITTPGTTLAMHQDQPDKIRYHITLKTNDSFKWIIDGEDIDIPCDGWVYIVNTTLPHMIINNGTTDRVSMYGKIWTDDVISLNL
jgi:hypothetical protein